MKLREILDAVEARVTFEHEGVEFTMRRPSGKEMQDIIERVDQLAGITDEKKQATAYREFVQHVVGICLDFEGDKPTSAEIESIIFFGGGYQGRLVGRCAELCCLPNIGDNAEKKQV